MPWIWSLVNGRPHRSSRVSPPRRAAFAVTTLEDRLAPAAAFSSSVGDFNGDGVPDVAVGAPGAMVAVVGGADGRVSPLPAPYEPAFTGAVSVASAGGRVAVGAGVGGGPRVRVFDPNGATLSDTFAFEVEFRGGVNVAFADVSGDGVPDAVAAAGPGGGPRVRVTDGVTGATLFDAFVFEPEFRGGVSVAAGDVDGDGRADLIVGAGIGGGPRVRVIRAADGAVLRDQFVGDPAGRGGVAVAAAFADGSGLANVATLAAGKLNLYAGRSPTPYRTADAGGATTLASGDVTGDGFSHVLAGGPASVTAFGGPDFTPTGFTYPGVTDAFAAAPPPATPALFDGKTLVAPGGPADAATVRVALLREYGPTATVGLYQVADATGRVGTLLPGDPGYLAAAFAARLPANAAVVVPGGRRYGLYVESGGARYVSFAAANPEGAQQLRFPGRNRVAVEAAPLGGEGEFHALIVELSATTSPLATTPLTPPVTPPNPVLGQFPADLVGFSRTDLGGTVGGTTVVDGVATLTEGDRFRVGFSKAFTVPAEPTAVRVTFDAPAFDATSVGRINDAFEIAVLAADGSPLALPTSAGRDAAFNWTEGYAPFSGPATNDDAGMATIDLSGLPAGTPAILVIRLVNNDRDTATSVVLRRIDFVNATGSALTGVVPSPARVAGGRVDLTTLTDVTPSLAPVYGRTTLTEENAILTVDLGVSNVGTYAVTGHLVVAVGNLSDPAVGVMAPDGFTPDGRPYFDLTAEVGAGLAPGAASALRTVQFTNPNRERFTYDLQVLAGLNRAPTIAPPGDAIADVGRTLGLTVAATDPDGQPLTFALTAGPVGMTIDPSTGRILYTPAAGAVGTHTVRVRVTDPLGATADGGFTLTVRAGPPNRPPVFTSTPPTDATLASPFEVQTYAAGTNPNAVTAADFGNGVSIVTADPGDQTLGLFGPDRVSTPVNVGEPRPGLTGAPFVTGLTVDLGLAPGTFENDQRDVHGLTVGDVNGDGVPDFAASVTKINQTGRNRGDGFIGVRLGNGDGTFRNASDIKLPDYFFGTGAVTSLANTVRLLDVTGDGKLDVAAVQTYGGRIVVYPGKGDGTFADPVTTDGSAFAESAQFADLNGDGALDVVLFENLDGSRYRQGLSVRFGDGTGAFGDETFTPADNDRGVAGYVVDANGDGRPDLVRVNDNDRRLETRLNDGSGGFGPALFSETAAYYISSLGLADVLERATSAQFGDFDSDGKTDAAIGVRSNGILILRGNGDGTFGDKTPEGNRSVVPINQTTALLGQLTRDGDDGSTRDLNGDGTPDVVFGSLNGPQVAVATGRGDGTFDLDFYNANFADDIGTGTDRGANATTFVAFADFNRDGVVDSLVGRTRDVSRVGGVGLLLGDRPATFRVPSTADTAAADVDQIVVGDFTNDGLDDLVTRTGAGVVSVAVGRGDGTFAPPQIGVQFSTGFTSSLAAADFDGDGNLDISLYDGGGVQNNNNNRYYQAFGLGDGTFQAIPPLDTPQGFGTGLTTYQTVVVGDFNGDSHPDLAYRLDGNGITRVEVLLFDPAARRFARVPDPAGLFDMPRRGGFYIDEALGYADLDGDGKAELFAHSVRFTGSHGAPDTPERLTVWTPTLDPTAATAATLVTRTVLTTPGISTDGPVSSQFDANSVSGYVVADFNGDGMPDLAASTNGSVVAVSFGNGDLTFRDRTVYLANAGYGVVGGDADGDGVLDLFLAGQFGDDNSTRPRNGVMLGRPDGTFGPVLPFALTNDTNGRSPAVGDFNRDGKTDYVTNGGPGLNTTALEPFLAAPPGLVGVAAGDLNGDGRPDLVAITTGFDRVKLLLGTGPDAFARQPDLRVDLSPVGLALGDVTGDGKLDIVTANRVGASVTLLYNATGFARTDVPLGFRPELLAIADLDGDGRADAVAAGSGTLGRLRGTAVGFAPVNVLPLGFKPTGLALADVTGDGIPDVVLADGTGNRLVFLPGSGDGTFGPPKIVPLAFAPGKLAALDVNADGKLDLAVLDPQGGRVGILFGRGGTRFTSPQLVTVGASPSDLTAADVNGDGKPDLLITNGGDDTLSVILNRYDPANLYRYTPTATDPDGDAVTFTIESGPGGVLFDDATQTFLWAPTPEQLGDNRFVVRAADGNGGFAEQGFAVRVTRPAAAAAPVFTSEPITATPLDAVYGYQPRATNPSGGPLRYSLVDGPSGTTVDPTTGEVTFDPRRQGLSLGAFETTTFRNRGYVSVPDSPSLRPESFTAETWFRPEAAESDGTLISKRSSSFVGFTWSLGLSNGTLRARLNDGSTVLDLEDVKLTPAGVWTHAAITYDGPTQRFTLVVNGVPVASAIAPRPHVYEEGRPLYVGFQFPGIVAGVRLFDEVRSPAQIAADLLTDVPSGTPGLVLDLRFRESLDVKTVLDSSPARNTGEITGTSDELFNYPPRVPAVGFAGLYPVTLRVEDGSGGVAEQAFTLRVTAPFPATITGTVFDDADGDGVRDRRVADNFVVNGAFTDGPVAFTNDLLPGTYTESNSSQQPGVFTVGPRLRALPGGPSLSEHTRVGPGSALLVTGTAADAVAWAQTVPVTPGTTYDFGFWAFRSNNDPARFAVRVNGQPVGDSFDLADTRVSQWGRFTAAWAAAATTTARIEIVLLGSAAATNPAAIDDITFAVTGTARVVVLASANPLLAGQTGGPAGETSPQVPLTLVAGQELRFAVAGSPGTDPSNRNYPAEGLDADTNRAAANGLSGLIAPRRAALVGVFLTDDAPAGAAPPTLDFRVGGNVPGGIDYVTLAPELRQLFFIGDGVTAEEVVQRITVPAGATRLFLGTLDLNNSNGNNSGGLDVAVFTTAEPEPGLAGRTVYLDADGNGRLDADEVAATTDANGFYTLAAGGDSARVALLGEPGRVQTAPESPTRLTDLAGDTSRIDFASRVVAAGPPRFVSVPPTAANVPSTFVYRAFAQSTDGSPITYGLAVAPDGAAIDAGSGRVTWTPKRADAGRVDFILTATDDAGRVTTQAVSLTVTANTPPTITSVAPTGAAVGVAFRYDVAAQDAEQPTLTYTLETAPAGATIDATGRISWTPAADQSGPRAFAVVVSDGSGGLARQSFVVAVGVAGPNSVPTITAGPRSSAQVGVPYFSTIPATDADGDALAFVLLDAPPWLTLDADGRLSGTPTDLGPVIVRVRVADGRGGSDDRAFTVDVGTRPVRATLAITSLPVASAVAGREYAYDLVAPGAVNFSVVAGPAGMSVDPVRGRVRFTPGFDQLGSVVATLRAADELGNAAEQTFTLTVRGVVAAPGIVSTPPTTGSVGRTYVYPVGVDNPAGSPLRYSLTVAPAGAAIDPETGVVSWTPSVGQAGDQSLIVRVTDGFGNFASQAFTVAISAGALNAPPIATSVPPTGVTVGESLNYALIALDADGEPLTFAVLGGPAGVTIDAATGVVTWVPAAADIGTVTVTLTATDPQGAAAVQSFLVDVRAANRPPAVTSIAPVSVPQGGVYRYDAFATDPDREPLFYSIVSGPVGLTVDALGRVRWQTALDTPLGPVAVTLRVADGRGGVVEQLFEVNVVPDTTAPRISIVIANVPLFPMNIRPATVRVTATDDVGVTGIRVLLDGVPVALRADGTFEVNYSDPANGRVQVFATDAAGNEGRNAARVSMRSGLEDGSGNGASAPTVSLDSIAEGATVGGFVSVIGTVGSPDLDRYTLSYRRADETVFTVITTGTSPVAGGPLGTWDTTLLENDAYVLKLEATDLFGGFAAVERLVGVSGGLKLGDFRLSFEDITVPVAGLPVTVARTYDTLRAGREGDFGFGWRLEFRDTGLRTSLPKSGLEDIGVFTPFRPGVKVYLTLPGGTREGFTFTPDIRVLPGFGGQGLAIATPRFTPDRGVTSSLSAGGGGLLVDAFGNLSAAGVPWNPASPDFAGYTLTTADGTRYAIDGATGLLTRATYRDGTAVTFTEAGVTGPDGVGVAFERDALGRITAATDPLGNSVRYAYSAAGDLASVTDLVGNVTRYDYAAGRPHFLETITDPLGRVGIRAEYGADGRLSAVVDAAGGRLPVTYDPANNLVTSRDPLGNPTVTEFDARGNVVAVTDALGGVTRTAYDAANNAVSETDPLGRTTTFVRDAAGRVTAETDPTGAVTRTTYSAAGDILTLTDPLGRTSTRTVSRAGDLTAETSPTGATATASYDAAGNLTAATTFDGTVFGFGTAGGRLNVLSLPGGTVVTTTYDAAGNATAATTAGPAGSGLSQTVSITRDAEGRVLTATDAAGSVTRTAYDAAGNRAAVTDPLGRVTRFDYDAAGRLVATIAPDGGTTRLEFDAAGRLAAETDAAGRITRYTLDAAGRRIGTEYPDGTRTAVEYDLAGQLSATVNELGNRTTFAYDAAGRPTSVTDPLGNVTTNAYDAAGNLVTATDPLGNVTRFETNVAGQVTATIAPDGTRTTTAYDGRGRPTARTDGAGAVTRYAYDGNGQLTAVTDSLGNVTRYGYDGLARLAAVTDALGRVTRYGFDAGNRPATTTGPTGEFESRTYDAAGQLTGVTDADGDVTRSEYDAAGRVTVTSTAGEAVVTTYTPDGQVATVAAGAAVTRYTYDARGRLLTKTDPDGQLIAYTYDAAGRELSVTSVAGTVSYTYDAAGRPATVTDAAGGVTRYTTDAAGRVVRTETPAGTVEAVAYDPVGRVTSRTVSDPDGDGDVLERFATTYDAAGRTAGVTDLAGRRTAYTFDAAGRLTSEFVTAPAAPDRVTRYTYDAANNRLTRDDSADALTTYTYDGGDRLVSTQVGGVTTTRTYDADGNLTAAGQTTYTWDAAGRLASATVPGPAGPTVVTYTYTPDGQRMTRTESGTTTRFVIDTNREYADAVAELVGGVVTAAFVRPAVGLGLVAQTADGETVYPHTGPTGSILLTTNEAGAIADRVIYDAFGRVISRVGSTPLGGLFGGAPRDGLTGFDYLRARHYDPATGRFASADSFTGFLARPISLNRYAFADQNPVNNADPSGRFTITPQIVALGIIATTTVGFSVAGVVIAEKTNTSIVKGAVLGAFAGLGIGLAAVGSGLYLLTLEGVALTASRLASSFVPQALAALSIGVTPEASGLFIVSGGLTVISIPLAGIAFSIFALIDAVISATSTTAAQVRR